VKIALFWVITQRVAVTPYRRFRTASPSHPTTSVRNYHYSLRNNPEERSSHLLRCWSLKSCKKKILTTLFDERE